MLGPRVAGLITNNAGLSWRYVYLFSLPLALVLFVPAIFSKFPETGVPETGVGEAGHTDTAGDGEGRKSFFDALKSPLVWLLSVTLGLAIIVEMNSANWGPMYFQDMYGLDPSTGGAAFLSAFFLVFTLSRLVCGFFVEKIGYMRTLMGVSLITLVIFCTGFFLGEKGIFVLPSLGFFIALLWPTIMAVAIQCFGKDAPVFSSAMIAIGGLINTVVQYLVGLTNKVFGSAWGYRSTVVYTVLLIFVLLVLNAKIKQTRRRDSF
jgi:fucose permease